MRPLQRSRIGIRGGYSVAATTACALMAAFAAVGAASADDLLQKPSAPRWTVSAEALMFGRSASGNQSLVSLVPGDVPWWTPAGPNTTNVPGVEALNSNQLNQRLAAGPRIGVSYRDPAGYGVELSYLNVLGLKASKSIGPETPGQWLVMKAPGTFWQTQDYGYQSMVWRDETRLHSLEANVRLELSPRVTLLAGVRWLQLHDQLQGTLEPADLGQPMWKFNVPSRLSDAVPLPGSPVVINPPFWTSSTSNNLYGVQVGARAALWAIDRVAIEGVAKIGLFDNHATQTALVSMQKQIYPASAATNAVAFVGQGGLATKYRLTDKVALKLGYEALWLGGLALGPGQIQATATTPNSVSTLGVNCRSTTFLQGVTVGMEYAF